MLRTKTDWPEVLLRGDFGKITPQTPPKLFILPKSIKVFEGSGEPFREGSPEKAAPHGRRAARGYLPAEKDKDNPQPPRAASAHTSARRTPTPPSKLRKVFEGSGEPFREGSPEKKNLCPTRSPRCARCLPAEKDKDNPRSPRAASAHANAKRTPTPPPKSIKVFEGSGEPFREGSPEKKKAPTQRHEAIFYQTR